MDRPRKFDLILANQVWEHLDRPYAATKHVRRMLKRAGISGLLCRFSYRFMRPLRIIRAGLRGASKTC
jgi:hypothetical protein